MDMYENDVELRDYGTDSSRNARSGLSQLQSRYVFPFAVCVFVSIFFVGLFLSLKSRELLREQLKKEQLSAARAGAQAVGNTSDAFFRLVESVAKSSVVKENDEALIKRDFNDAIRHAPAAKSLFLFNAKAKLISSSNSDGETVRVVSQDPCFDKVRGGATSCFSSMYRTDDGSQRAYVFMPVFSEKGTPTRLLVGGMDIGDKAVQAIVLGINPGRTGFSMLVDSAGKLVLSGDPNKENLAGDVSELPSVKSVLSGKMGSETYKYGKTHVVATFYPVDPLGWGFIVQRPMKEASAGVGDMYKILFIFLILGTGAAVALALVQAQGLTRFLYLLGKRMDAVASGQRDQTIGADEAFGLDRLSSSFNRMVEMIERTWVDGSRELEDVKKTAQFNAGLLSSIQDLFIVTDPRLKVLMMNEKAEVFIPAASRPAMGRFMTDLGHAWGQRRLQEAAQKVMESGEVASLSSVRFTTPDRADTSIFDFRIYPVPSTQGVFFYGREVSEFVATVEKVQNSERFFREVATDLADPMLVINNEYKVEWVNPAVSRLFHIEDDFLGVNWMECVIPSSRETMQSLIENSPDDDTTAQVPEEVIVMYNNQKLRIEVAVGRMNLGNAEKKFVVSFRVVPSTRLLEREALRNKKKLENKIKFLTAAIESMPEVFAITGLDGQFIMVNSAFADLFKEKKEVFVGKKIDVIHAAEGPLVDLPTVALEGFIERETFVKNFRGEKFKAHVVGATVQNGSHTGYIISVKEIETEERNKIYERKMLETKTRSRMARTISGKLEGVISHLGDDMQLLGGNIFADDTREMWHNSMTHVKELALAVNSLHMYSVDTSISLLVCGIEDIINDTINQLNARKMIPDKVKVEMTCPSECPKMNADADHLRMVLWHVLKNAVEAASNNEVEGSVLVRAYPADIDGTQAVIVEVLDDGPEYDVSKIDHFFEPFFGDKEGGIGLGLTLARRAVVKHCGRMGVQRADSVTRASFYIPLNLTPKQITRSVASARS